MTLFHLETVEDGILVTETRDGRKIRCHFNTVQLAESHMKHRRDVIELGIQGALKKWNREANKERRKLGLPCKSDYSVIHYGDEKEAACGVEKGVSGNIRQRVIDHTWHVKKVTCPECRKAMG